MNHCKACHGTKLIHLLFSVVPCTDCAPPPNPPRDAEAPTTTFRGGCGAMNGAVNGAVSTASEAPHAGEPRGAGLDEMLALVVCTHVIQAGAVVVFYPPLVDAYLEPRYAMLAVVDAFDVATLRKAWVNSVTIRGMPQEDAFGQGHGITGVPSDAYDQWVRVPWGTFSRADMGSPLRFEVMNLSPHPVRASLLVRGRPTNDAPDFLGTPKSIP